MYQRSLPLSLFTGALFLVSDTLSDQIVIVDGDTAVVVGTDTERSTKKGEAHIAVARYTATYVRRNGRWLALAEHLALVPQAK